MDFHADTPAVFALRSHLLRRSRDSIPPSVGITVASVSTPEEDEVLRRFAPFASLLYLVASVDGHTDERERAVILGAFRTLTGGRVPGARLSALESGIRERIQHQDIDELLEDAATLLSLNRQDAELGFTLAAAVIVADEVIDERENAFLSQLASWLGIPPSRATQLLDGS